MLDRSGNSRKHLILAVLLPGVLLPGMLIAAALLGGYLSRKTTMEEIDRAAAKRKSTPPIVNPPRVTRAPNGTEGSFPGSITPITGADIYRRAAGYLKKRYGDIGDRVA